VTSDGHLHTADAREPLIAIEGGQVAAS